MRSFATRRADSPDLVNRRLVGAVLLSLVLHGLLLLLRFGLPGLGLPSPSTSQPISIVLAPALPAPEVAVPAESPPPLPAPAPASGGMRVVAPAPPAPKPVVAKRSKPRRISRPVAPRELVETPTPVIAQDLHPNDFIAPMPQPQPAEQQTADPKEAREGSDDGAAQAALLAETLRKEEEERTAAQARQEQERLAAARLAEQQQQAARADELAARQKADDLARQQAADAARQQAEQLARQQADQLKRQEAEQLTRQQAEQLAKQQAEQLARQQAEQLAKQQAEQSARQQAEQTARQQAAAAAAADRERAAAAASAAVAGNNSAGAPGGGSSATKNPLGSDLGNRVRELTRGIDLLSGAPPPRTRDDSERGARRVVSGGAEQDVSLRMYVDSFRQKVERNGGGAAGQRGSDPLRTEPLVSVAIRSDGSVEEVTIVRSSGHADTDNAVRRIVRLNARYSAFPPTIAARYDVIEIRRIWSFADSLKLLEELR